MVHFRALPCSVQEHRGVGGLFFDDVDAATAGYDVEQVGRC